MPCFNFPQKALWFPERKDQLPSMCGRGPSGVGGRHLENCVAQGQCPKEGWEVRYSLEITYWKVCVLRESGPRWSGEQPQRFAHAYNKKSPGVCAFCCVCVMFVHYISSVCRLFYMCMLYILTYLHYICYTCFPCMLLVCYICALCTWYV